MTQDEKCLRCQSFDSVLTKKDEEIVVLNERIQFLENILFTTVLQKKDEKIMKLKQRIQDLEKLLSNTEHITKLFHSACRNNSNYVNQNFSLCKSNICSGDQQKTINDDSDIGNEKSSESSHEDLVNQAINQDISAEDNWTVNNTSTKENNSSEQNNEEYVYDEKFKMYYSISTGYYYDRTNDLFYIPQNGAFYKYDYINHKYELYEQSKNDTNLNVIEKGCDLVVDKVNDLKESDTEDEQGVNLEPEDLDEQTCNSRENDDIDRKYETSLKKSNVKNKITSEPSKDWQTPEGSNVTVQDLVREVAEQNSGMSDYIYDEKYQMYCSKSTGYFYDPIKKLLYDPNQRVYYLYNEVKLTYDFYCYADSILTPTQKKVPPNLFAHYKKNSAKMKRDKTLKKYQDAMEKNCKENSLKDEEKPRNEKNVNDEENISSPESGEIFSSDSEPESPSETGVDEDSTVYLPCIRAIVKSSDELKIGTLILITCTGSIMGRDKTNAVHIPDISVSKVHAEVKFSYESRKYCIQDLGSQNGTFINELRLSEPKQKSEFHNLTHGDKLTLGFCKMLLHIHEGYETCDKCEPGQVMAEVLSQAKVLPVLKTKEEKEKERRTELRNMKKKYGLRGMDFQSEKSAVFSAQSGYEDKAEIRRKTVGSQNPYEKTEMSSMNETMSKSNKGYQMLRKLGWNEGESLGALKSGISEPIPIRPWVSKAGLGSAYAETAACAPVQEDRRKLKWVKAQERYFQLPDVSLNVEEA